MPEFTLNSPVTGKIYRVEAPAALSAEDQSFAISQFDAPILKELQTMTAETVLSEDATKAKFYQDENFPGLGLDEIVKLGGELPGPEGFVEAPLTTSADESLERIITKSRQAGGFPEFRVTPGERLTGRVLGTVAAPAMIGADIAEAAGIPLGIGNIPAVRASRLERGALAEGALGTVTGTLSDAIARRLGVPSPEESESAQAMAPGAALSGTIAGALLPAGTVAAPAKSALSKVGRGAATGALFGLATGVGEEIATEEEPTLGGVLEKSLVPVSLGTLAGVAIPSAVTVAAKVKGRVLPSREAKFTMAIRPINRHGMKWDDIVKNAPSIIKSLSQTEVTDMRTAILAGKEARSKLLQSIRILTNNPNGVTVDGKKIYAQILREIRTEKLMRESPEEITRLAKKFKSYDGPISLQKAEQILEETNAELSGPVYNRTAEGAKTARTNAETRADEALAKGLRAQINEAIDLQLGEKGFGKELKRAYGDVATFNREAERRYLVALRQAQDSLPEQIAYSNSAFDIISGLAKMASGGKIEGIQQIAGGAMRSAAAKMLREANKADNLIASAFKQVERAPSKFDPARMTGAQPRTPPPTPGTNLPPPTSPTPPGTVTTGPGGPTIAPGDLEAFIRQSLSRPPPE